MKKLNDLPFVHRHEKQQEFLLRMANTNYAILPRGWGKTTAAMADFSLYNAESMPQSSGTYVAKSFAQALTSTLPPLIDGYTKLGLTEGVHFKVGGYFPKSTNVPRPHIGPLKTDHIIHFCNGSIMVIASQDRNSVADNGKSTDWGVIDEAKFIDHKRLQEEFIIPMRGNIDRFGHLWNHLSTLYCSDLPDFMDHWLLKAEHQINAEVLDIAMAIRVERHELLAKFVKSQSAQYQKRILKKIDELDTILNELLKNEVMFMEGKTSDNIGILGLDYFIKQSNELSPIKYLRSLSGYRISANEQFYYPMYREDVHGYDSIDYSHIDNIGLEKAIGYQSQGSHEDIDCINNLPLLIAGDANANFNCLTVWQKFGNEIKCIKELYVEGENYTTKDCAKLFCQYYKEHGNKQVRFVFDHTFINSSARSRKGANIKQDYVNVLRSNGWRVIEEYIGQQPSHKERLTLIRKAMAEDGSGALPKIRVNKINCPALNVLIKETGREMREDGYMKDKSSEKDPNIPGHKATHLTDGFDTGAMYYLKLAEQTAEQFVGIGIHT